MHGCTQPSTQFRQPNLIKLRTKAYLEFNFLFSTSNVLSYLLSLNSKVLNIIDHIFDPSVGKRRPHIFSNHSGASQREMEKVCKSEHFPPS